MRSGGTAPADLARRRLHLGSPPRIFLRAGDDAEDHRDVGARRLTGAVSKGLDFVLQENDPVRLRRSGHRDDPRAERLVETDGLDVRELPMAGAIEDGEEHRSITP